MAKTIKDKREREKEVVGQMIALYCKKQHQNRQELCMECKELLAYACYRSDVCPFMETKTFCSNCKVHCYQADMRERIRQVMRFAGPRIILYHPVLAIRHIVETRKEKRRLEKEGRENESTKNDKESHKKGA